MRTTVPPAFSLAFKGPEGPYVIQFEPTDDWDGVIDVSIGGQAMRWPVLNVEREGDEMLVLGGTTDGAEALWGDQFWFDLHISQKPPVIRYWGDQVLWREDLAAA